MIVGPSGSGQEWLHARATERRERLPEALPPPSGAASPPSSEQTGATAAPPVQALRPGNAGRDVLQFDPERDYPKPQLDGALGGRARRALNAYQQTAQVDTRDELAQLIGIDVYA